jgi:hypothetical protein
MANVQVPAEGDREQLWQSIEDTLRDHYFELEREDRFTGIITTEPETSAQWFEFWRPQPQPDYYWWEANINTIQRKVEVHWTPLEEEEAINLRVRVDRFGYNLEERQIDNSAAALRLYSVGAPTISGETESAAESGYWSHLGRDEYMERLLLDKIRDRYEEKQLEQDDSVQEEMSNAENSPATTRPA